MQRVSFSAHPQQESLYQKDLLHERAWFDRAGMEVYLPVPKGKIASRNDVLRARMIQFRAAWRPMEASFFRQAKLLRHAKIASAYHCHCSPFGPEGKYRRPNQIFVRLRTARDRTLATETLAHELIHLFFADFSETKHCSYAEREGIVDAVLTSTLFRQLFPRYHTQSIGRVPQHLLHAVLPVSQETGKGRS